MFEGILLVNKPEGFTSFDVVAKLRGITKTKKIGHAGTLDPIATGVLPVFLGRAAKAVDLLPNHDKTYEAVFKLGIETDTQDITGRIVAEKPHNITRDEVRAALETFAGEVSQLPPMYSAVKVNGRKLYDIARSGGEAERNPKIITVYIIDLIDSDETAGTYKIRVECSRGTYIRTICHDLGQKLNCGAVMTQLVRTAACGYSLADCLTLNEIQALKDENMLESRILPVSTAFSRIPKFILNTRQADYFCGGLELGLYQFEDLPEDGTRLSVYDETGRFLGLARIDAENDRLKIIKIFRLR